MKNTTARLLTAFGVIAAVIAISGLAISTGAQTTSQAASQTAPRTKAQRKAADLQQAQAERAMHGQSIEIAIAPGLDVKYPLTGRVLVCIAKIEKTETGAAGGNGAT